MDSSVDLITIKNSDQPYIKAARLAEWLEYKSVDGVSQIVRRRKDDFNSEEVIYDEGGNMLLNYDGALKICIFSPQPKAKQAREEVIAVYKSWRSGEIYSYEKVSGTQQALLLAKAVQKLAEEQLRQEKKLEEHDAQLEDVTHRLSVIEAKQNKGFISESQMGQITVAVRQLGQLLSAGNSRSMYGIVYTKMYEKFGVSSYKNIPADMFEDVMGWLTGHMQKAAKQIGKTE